MAHKMTQSKREQRIRSFVEKIVINAGVGRATQSPNFEEKILPQIVRDLGDIAGQKPQTRPARKSIAGFKIREGQVVGAKVTLRRKKMVDFLERMITIILPRVRDFNGIPLSNVDKEGSLNLGFKEQFVAPEINPEVSPSTFSFGVNITPKVKHREEAVAFYKEIGMPFKK